jgi:hypothetical protein
LLKVSHQLYLLDENCANETRLVAVYRYSDIYLMAEENPRRAYNYYAKFYTKFILF